jgi:hypothetical protein
MATIYGETSGDLLGSLVGANMNSTADQTIPLALTKSGIWIPSEIIVKGASTSLSLAAGGIYSAASKGGTAIVAAGQLYSALTGTTKFLRLTLAALTDYLTATQLFLSLTVAQGGAGTASFYVYERELP